MKEKRNGTALGVKNSTNRKGQSATTAEGATNGRVVRLKKKGGLEKFSGRRKRRLESGCRKCISEGAGGWAQRACHLEPGRRGMGQNLI